MAVNVYIHATREGIPWFHYWLGQDGTNNSFNILLKGNTDWTLYKRNSKWKLYQVSMNTITLLLNMIKKLTIFPEAITELNKELQLLLVTNDCLWFIWIES
tara:strand:+ start:2596 stop:2898 length:303 start_codon:yes stop_codon:yes gene_type:complete